MKTIDIPDYGNEVGVASYDMVKDQIQAMNSQKVEITMKAQAKDEEGDGGKGKMSQELRQKIIDRHLFGVPPPPNRKIFDDSEASFNWFKDRCSITNSIIENREILKTRINEAKTLGLQAEQSRKTIEYLKKTIEQIRRDR